MPNVTIIALIVLLPLAAFLLLGLLGETLFKGGAGIMATMLMLVAAGLALYTAYQYFFVYGSNGTVYQQYIPWQITWLPFYNGLSINIGFLVDPISVMMLVVVTFISLMVHIYSLGYMKGEGRLPVYFAFLGLFTFSMLGLVLASNIFQTYIFWELVGVSSFLLIGFYYNRPAAVAACKKAFIVTRFADFGFLVGILILSFCANTLDFTTLIQKLTAPGSNALKTATTYSFMGVSALSWGAALVFVGGAGKSAMFPLHIWLPDAMEGPTPVSALIHAATMVVAGVYLVARLFPVFAITTPEVLQMVGWVGVVSAFVAAIIACTQTDIKRVLAYSTMSQIGFMMFALGVSKYGGEQGLGYTAAMFHLFTHAMFKALLFLGAGSVIHYVHSNDMAAMGGLRKQLPITHITFLIACLAIAGIPPFAGFFSKEEILLAAYQHNTAIYCIALVTSGLTAFYMFRLYFGIFWGKPFETHGTHHHGEGGLVMLLPLVLLAVGAAAAGFIPFGHFVTSDGSLLESSVHVQFSLVPVGLAVAGIFMATWMYKTASDRPLKMAASFKGLYKAAYHKFYIDELYLFITKKILFNGIGKLAAWFDKSVVDGLVNLSGTCTVAISTGIKKWQSGKLQGYALYFLGGVIVLAAFFIYVWK